MNEDLLAGASPQPTHKKSHEPRTLFLPLITTAVTDPNQVILTPEPFEHQMVWKRLSSWSFGRTPPMTPSLPYS